MAVNSHNKILFNETLSFNKVYSSVPSQTEDKNIPNFGS